MKKRFLIPTLTAAAVLVCTPVLAAEPEFSGVGSTYEYGHFTVEAIALDANSEDFNENASFTVYSINDYTAAVPMADSYDANGATTENNTSSTYMILSDTKALVIDLGNGASATASHFGEDSEDEEVLAAIDAEYKDLIFSLAGDREVEIAITHNHGDHLGYCSALAGENLKLYFPKADYTDSVVENYGDFAEMYDLETFEPGELTLSLDNDLTVETVPCIGHTSASTIYVIDTPVVTYEYDDAEEATGSEAEYLVFTGDAIGSGSSGWIFSADSIKTLTTSVENLYDKLATYNTYNDYLSDGEVDGATIKIEGGHGWQIWNRFGDMSMDLSYVESMKTLLEKIPEGNWVAEGTDGKTLEELLQEGNLVTKPVEGSFLDTTIYYGTELTSVAGITTFMDALNEVAGISTEEAE